ncbi:pilus assembly protein PilM [Bacillus sp. MUM 13]|uniref:type IV pilus biogenesis protein PilM n=1 Tax=Bacillus sp. MUM 13 TaxID=1678001 RepID=UPI0008F585F0|nr:pilus assembly protein PilM [Bacillus sp. MUM 13]OIK14344.1 hypothetical protein BIV59_03575 [Bacillus sp. MUM 13]
MPLSFFTGKNRIVNLVIKDHAIRFVEFKQNNPPVVSACGEHYLPSGIIKDGKIMDYGTLQNILEQCLDEWKLSKREVRFLVPDPFVVIRKLSIPKDIKDDEIEGYLYLELGTSIHLPFEDPVFDAVVLGESEEKREILLFAAPEEIVSEYSGLLEESKLRPIAADISALALYRLYFLDDRARAKKGAVMLLQFDLLTVNASIFADDKPIFMRHIPVSGDIDDWEQGMSRLGNAELVYGGQKEQYFQTFEDSFTEIERVLDFYKYSLNEAQEDISEIVICGDHPYLDDIISRLENRVAASVIKLSRELNDPEQNGLLAPSYYAAAGLALKGVR